MTPARPPCPRCLLADAPRGEDLLATIRAQLAALPEGTLADPAATARRLAACRACEHLADGMCALCGCYVEYRAALRRRACPHLPPRWPAENG